MREEISELTAMARIVFSDSEFEEYEERAAVMQFDGGLSLEEAERRAYLIVADKQ